MSEILVLRERLLSPYFSHCALAALVVLAVLAVEWEQPRKPRRRVISKGKRMVHPYLADVDGPKVLAHRGFVSQADHSLGVAENTRASFAAALAAGANFVETDCHVTSDGELVLAHDADLSRVLGDPRAIAEVRHAELAELMADRGGLMTLAQLLEEFPDTRFNIDVKTAAAAEPLGRTVAPHGRRVLITSFSDEYRLRAMRAARDASGLGVGAVAPATSPGKGTLARLLIGLALRSRGMVSRALSGVDALQIPERSGRIRVLSPQLIDAAHATGVDVHVWTVNDPAQMRELVVAGVDGVVTDRADLAVRELRG